ncbi:S-methyl-5'-thioinosine phosphorylase [archaeon BMS3Abin16]|nr:S-methyl-5'-thioinosine phosphorylase [archaeon BMS3Abin16]
MIAIIGGTGFYDPDFLDGQEEIVIETPFGRCQAVVGKMSGVEVMFISRHGKDHSLPPHRVEYRKNIAAIQAAQAKAVISINSVGSLDLKIEPGSVLIPNDFIDLSKNRAQTFFDSETVHVDMSEPYCSKVRFVLEKSAAQNFQHVHGHGIYVCTEGPRFETPAEIKMLRMLGGDVVGMVGCPETALAREAGLCYASICQVANYGCGLTDNPLTVEELKMTIEQNQGAVKNTIISAVKDLNDQKRSCNCGGSQLDAKI